MEQNSDPQTNGHICGVKADRQATHTQLLVYSVLVFNYKQHHTYPPHPCNGLFSRTSWVSWYKKNKTSLNLNEARHDGHWDAAASAGPYANNLRLVAQR